MVKSVEKRAISGDLWLAISKSFEIETLRYGAHSDNNVLYGRSATG